MLGLKFLFKDLAAMRVFFWLTIVITAGSMVLLFFFNTEVGSEDYLFQKLFVSFPAMFTTELGLICGCRNLPGNKLVRSFPIAKSLYTRAVPAYVVILSLGVTAFVMTVDFIYLGIIGAEECQFADTLICAAVVLPPMIMVSAPAARVPAGGLLDVYVVIIPVLAVVWIGGKNLTENGFGLPLSAAAAIFAGAVMIAVVFAFWISAVLYKKSNVKILQQIPVK